MADAAPPLAWKERKNPREWSAVAGDPGATLVAIVHRAYDAPVALVEFHGGHPNQVLTAKARLFRRRSQGWDLIREGYADTVVQAKEIAAEWIARLTTRAAP